MILELQGLTFRWPARTIGPLDWALGPGLYQLPGANGAGKTTVLRLIAGALRPHAGVVRLLGRDVHADPRAKRELGYLAVRPELPDFLTVDDAWAMLAAVRDRPDWDGRPHRDALGIPGDAPLSALSAGQRRRAEWIAAIAGDPALLLLDEPFADLDPAGRAYLADTLAGWRTDRAVLFVHHGESPVAGAVPLSLGSP